MPSVPLVDDEHLVVSLPPPGPAVVLTDARAVVDFVFTLQPRAEALVALCDDHRHVLLVVTTVADRLLLVPEVARRAVSVSSAVVVTAHPGQVGAAEEAVAEMVRLEAGFAAVGVRLADWLQVDDLRTRSVRALASRG